MKIMKIMKIEDITYIDFVNTVIEYTYLDDWCEELCPEEITVPGVSVFRYFYKGKTFEELYTHYHSRKIYEYLKDMIPRLEQKLLELINE